MLISNRLYKAIVYYLGNNNGLVDLLKFNNPYTLNKAS